MNEKQKKKAVVRDMQKNEKRQKFAFLVPMDHQFQPSEFAAATGAEMKPVRPELPIPLRPLPWLSRPLDTPP